MIPTVSVVISTFNYGRFLAGTLDSVLGQTFQDLEVVVVDDGSTDETPQVIEPYLHDSRVRYERINHEGVVAAKNRGIRLARGPFVAFLDADDSWLPPKLERQLAVFQADPDLGVVYTRRLLMDEEGYELAYEQPPLLRGMILEQMFSSNFVCFSSAVVARRVIDEVGGLQEGTSPSDDYDFWLRVARRFRFDYVDEPLVRYRTGHLSLSRREERIETVLRILRRFLQEPGNRELVSPVVIRTTFAHLYCLRALAYRDVSRLRALRWYLGALAVSPSCPQAWKGLASLSLSASARRCLRRALGYPGDWTTRQRTSARRVYPSPSQQFSLMSTSNTRDT